MITINDHGLDCGTMRSAAIAMMVQRWLDLSYTDRDSIDDHFVKFWIDGRKRHTFIQTALLQAGIQTALPLNSNRPTVTFKLTYCDIQTDLLGHSHLRQTPG
eukprot:COSAG03_NODE_7520_length_906_cov_2.852540_1_plen_101_part_10